MAPQSIKNKNYRNSPQGGEGRMMETMKKQQPRFKIGDRVIFSGMTKQSKGTVASVSKAPPFRDSVEIDGEGNRGWELMKKICALSHSRRVQMRLSAQERILTNS
jgi:hypothetical protein